MKKNKLLYLILIVFLVFILSSCEGATPYAVISVEKIRETEEGIVYEITFVDNNRYEFIVPLGEKGKDGDSPYIGNNGNWWIGDQDTKIIAEAKDGIDGVDGTNGINGLTPYIGNNGNWWLGDEDLGVNGSGYQGSQGKDGLTPHIGNNGNWWLGDEDTNVKATAVNGKDGENGTNGVDGTDGLTPYIGNNGNWWLGDSDTKIKAEATDGQNGVDGINGVDGTNGLTPYIGSNGNWWLGDQDTNVHAEAINGKDGSNGINGIDGLTPYIGNNGNWWIGDEDTKVFAGEKHHSIPNTGELVFGVNNDGQSYVLVSYSGIDRYVTIPKYHNGFPVTEIADEAFKGNNSVMTVYIPNTIKLIGDEAFSDSKLEKVIFEDESGLETIKKHAFKNTKLTEITIPNSVLIIEEFIFQGIVDLTIYVDLDEKPHLWDDNWKEAGHIVHWKN